MTFDVYVLSAEGLQDGRNLYCTVESSSMRSYYLNGKSQTISQNPLSPEFDPDERNPFRLSILRATGLRFRIYNKNKIFADELLYQGEITKLVDQQFEEIISVPLVGQTPKAIHNPDLEKAKKEDKKEDDKSKKKKDDKDKTRKHRKHHRRDTITVPTSTKKENKDDEPKQPSSPVLYVKIMYPVPYKEYTDWNPTMHSLFCCISYPTKQNYSGKPVAGLELLSVNSDKKIVRPFGPGRKPEKWIRYDSETAFLGINGAVNVIKICSKRCPKQVFIPLINCAKDNFNGKLTVTFYASPKVKRGKNGVKIIDDTNRFPKIIKESSFSVDSYGVFASGHILMIEPGRPPKFVTHEPRKVEDESNYIDFAKHYGPTVFKASSCWVYQVEVDKEFEKLMDEEEKIPQAKNSRFVMVGAEEEDLNEEESKKEQEK